MNFSSKYNPWLYFPLAALSLTLLSYFSLPPAGKWAIGLVGLALPTLWALRLLSRASSPQKVHRTAEIPSRTAGLYFVLLLGAGFLFRFYGLTTLSAWPMPDEGIEAFYSRELLQKGHWHFFYGYSQTPDFLYCTLQAFFFKLFGPSLFSLWFLPAVLSILSVVAAYFSARLVFSRKDSLFALFLMGGSFWSLYAGRFGLGVSLTYLWEILTLGTLAVFIKAAGDGQRLAAAVVLGTLVGTGLWHSVAWPLLYAVAVGIFLTYPLSGRRRHSIGFFVPLLLATLPFLWVCWSQNYGEYLLNLLAWRQSAGWCKPLTEGWQYVAALFTGPGNPLDYGPLWGGMLNPFCGALALMGMLEIYRNRRTIWAKWAGLALVLFLAPAFLAKDFDIFRILLAFPVFWAAAVLGLQTLCRPFPTARGTLLAILLLTLSTGLDLYHLAGPYHRLWGTPTAQWDLLKSAEFRRAFQILEPLAREEGPGAVLPDLWGQTGDETLTLACYAFDAAHNPGIPLEKARWVAVLADANYKPFLAKRFPQGRWFWLGSLRPGNPGGLMMGVIPLGPENRRLLSDWVETDRRLESVTYLVLESNPRQTHQRALDLLSEFGLSVPRDLFLQSCFWEKVYYLQAADNHSQGMLEALLQGLQKGYPLAHIYNDEGELLEQLGRKAEARRAFQKALAAPLDLTSAPENLKKLDSLSSF